MGLSLHHLKFENDNYFFSLFFRWFNQLSFLFHHSLSPSLSISVSLSAYTSSYVCLFLCIHMNNRYHTYILYKYMYMFLSTCLPRFFFFFFFLTLYPSFFPFFPRIFHTIWTAFIAHSKSSDIRSRFRCCFAKEFLQVKKKIEFLIILFIYLFI